MNEFRVCSNGRSWTRGFANRMRGLFWLILIGLIGLQLFGSDGVVNARNEILGRLEQSRKSRVIALVHRQESVSVLGVPVSSHISVEDSEAILRAIRFIPAEQPIDLVLHTPGGVVLASEQIAKALGEHQGKVTVFVPHYAMSGGALIALAADEIVMDANAVLGPVDPQIGGLPTASNLRMVDIKKPAQCERRNAHRGRHVGEGTPAGGPVRRPGAGQAHGGKAGPGTADSPL